MHESRGISRRAFLGAGQNPALRVTQACFALGGVVCQSCGDACPEDAIRFSPRPGAPPRPSVDTEVCTGCGECASACPADAIEMLDPAGMSDG